MNDRLSLDYGARYERFEYDLPSTNTPGRDFWYAAAQNDFCYQPVTLITSSAPALACPDGFVHPDGKSDPVNGQHLLLSSVYDPVVLRQVWEPRFAFTYALNPDTVLRGAYGRYSQPMYGASVQYNTSSETSGNTTSGTSGTTGFLRRVTIRGRRSRITPMYRSNTTSAVRTSA